MPNALESRLSVIPDIDVYKRQEFITARSDVKYCSDDCRYAAQIKRQEQLKRHRIKSRERYQNIKAGEHAVGLPITLPCKCCGQEFASKLTNALFCGPNCRAKFYRQEAAESRSRACTCESCGKEFITTRKFYSILLMQENRRFYSKDDFLYLILFMCCKQTDYSITMFFF